MDVSTMKLYMGGIIQIIQVCRDHTISHWVPQLSIFYIIIIIIFFCHFLWGKGY